MRLLLVAPSGDSVPKLNTKVKIRFKFEEANMFNSEIFINLRSGVANLLPLVVTTPDRLIGNKVTT